MAPTEEKSYFHARMQELGVTDQNNVIAIQKNDVKTGETVNVNTPIFTKHDKGIEILVYTLNRTTIRISKEGSRYKKDWTIVRLEKPIVKSNGDTLKYLMPKGQGSYPFFPPSLIEKFEAKKPIDTLYLTEGFFKAFKGHLHGLDVIGLPSITHMKSKETGTIHPEILQLVLKCEVKRVVWLVDGDCLDISKDLKDDKDLYKRPQNFFQSASTFKQLLDDYEIEKYFIHVNSDEIDGKPKGLDDLLIAHADKASDIVADLQSVSKPGNYFVKHNITYGLGRLRKYFHLNDVNDFYHFHAEKRPDIKGKIFVFNGTKYQYNDEKSICEIRVPGEANLFFRVGNDYYKFLMVPNKHKQLERRFEGRKKGLFWMITAKIL
jgi:hypothetical protein